MDGRRCSSAGQIIYPFVQATFLPTIKWAAEMPPFFIAKKWQKRRKIVRNFHFFVLSAVKKGVWENNISFKMAGNTA